MIKSLMANYIRVVLLLGIFLPSILALPLICGNSEGQAESKCISSGGQCLLPTLSCSWGPPIDCGLGGCGRKENDPDSEVYIIFNNIISCTISCKCVLCRIVDDMVHAAVFVVTTASEPKHSWIINLLTIRELI